MNGRRKINCGIFIQMKATHTHIFTQVNERATASGNVATATMHSKSHNQNVGERKI